MKASAKPPLLRKAPAARAKLRESPVGSFRDRLDWAWICRCFAARGVEPRHVEDMAQEALIRWTKAEERLEVRPGWTRQEARRAVLRTIIRRMAARYFDDHHERNTELRDDLEGEVAPAPPPEDVLEESTRQRLLDEALAHLRQSAPKCHEMVMACDLGDTSVAQIARSLHMSTGTVASRLRRGRKALWAFARRHRARQRFAA